MREAALSAVGEIRSCFSGSLSAGLMERSNLYVLP